MKSMSQSVVIMDDKTGNTDGIQIVGFSCPAQHVEMQIAEIF